MNSTLERLNSKIWYRMIKVIFFFFLICSQLISFIVVWEDTAPEFDNKASYFVCDDGRKIGLDENDITLYSEYVSYYDDESFKKACAYNPNDPININPDNPGDLARLNPKEKNYTLVPIYIGREWYQFIKQVTLQTIIILFIFELIRRVFYYIVLGTFKPSK